MKILLCLLALTTQLFGQSHSGVVITVHGFLQNERSVYDLQRALCCVGLKTYNFHYSSTTGTIRSHGEDLARFTQCVANQNPGEEINFVTHSLGALLLRVASNDPCFPQEAKIGRAVLFAPPSRGSEIGRKYLQFSRLYRCLGFELCHELSTYDVCDVMELGPYPECMKILIIAGCRGSNFFADKVNDGVIALDETRIEHPFYFETFYVTHYRILHYPPALELTRRFILNEFSDEECD